MIYRTDRLFFRPTQEDSSEMSNVLERLTKKKPLSVSGLSSKILGDIEYSLTIGKVQLQTPS